MAEVPHDSRTLAWQTLSLSFFSPVLALSLSTGVIGNWIHFGYAPYWQTVFSHPSLLRPWPC